MKGNQLYNLSAIKTVSRGNELFVQKMVDIFCDQTPALVFEMQIALRDNNSEKLKKIAHQLKPSIDGIGISQLKKIIRDLEDTENQEIANNALSAMLDTLEDIVNKVVTQLRVEYPAQS